MIFDDIRDWDAFRFSPAVAKAFAFLDALPVSAKEGVFEIQGRDIYAMVQSYETTQESAGKLEAHRDFIDIQYCLEGEEVILVAPEKSLSVQTPYSKESDVAFYDLSDEALASKLVMTPGRFAVLFPRDAHYAKRAVAAPCRVRKVVVKVACNLF